MDFSIPLARQALLQRTFEARTVEKLIHTSIFCFDGAFSVADQLFFKVPGNEKLVPILVDTYVDMAQHDVSRPGVFTVRARVVQEDNVPTRLWIPPNATLRAHLVRRRGQTKLRRACPHLGVSILKCATHLAFVTLVVVVHLQALGNYLVFCDGQLEDDIEFDLTASGGGLERGMTRSMSRLPSRPPEWSYCYFEDILNAAFHQRRRRYVVPAS